MRNLILSLIPIICLLSACSSDLDYGENMMNNSPEYTDSGDIYAYVQTRDTTKLNQPDALKERLAKCDLSEPEVKLKTTENLVKSILNYPVNYLILFYDNPENAVSVIIKNSAVHRELLKRKDAPQALLECYRELDIKDTPYADIMFFEAFLASDYVIPILKNKSLELGTIVSEKLEKRLSERGDYSMHSIKSILKLSELCGFKTDIQGYQRGGEFVSYTTIYTPLNHQRLEGIIFNELSETEITSYDQYMSSNYPNATILAPASARYNCHSYAWHEQSTDNNVWLNAYDSFGFFQLERYWTNDLYVEMDAPYYAKKVYYADGDHSAVVSSPGLYVSKWGPGPLIRHAPDYCPYDTSDMRYFFIPDQVQCSNNVTINGDNHIIINTENMYTVPDRIGTTYQWSVEYMNNPTMSDSYESFSFGMHTFRLKCMQYGAYVLRVDEYYGDIHTGYGQMIIIVEGN